MTVYCQFDSALGEMLLVSNSQSLTGVYFAGQKHFPSLPQHWEEAPAHPLLRCARNQIHEYFFQDRRSFELPLTPKGTDFQRQVWAALLDIPYGKTLTYGEIAEIIGSPKSVRAVAGAIGRNPLSLLIPCHRVIGANGSLTGYAGGLSRKQALLQLEGALAGPPTLSVTYEIQDYSI